MKKLAAALLVVVGLVLMVGPVLAQEPRGTAARSGDVNPAGDVYPGDRGASSFYGNAFAAGIGAGIAILGAGLGFGRIGA